jgi:isopenicillin N synthase-like dioxygenase
VSIVNHGIKPQVVQGAFAASKAFFNLPASEKLKVAWTTAEANRGYLGVGKEALYAGKPDVKETFECGHEADPEYRNLWPEEHVLPNFRKTLLTFFYQADKVHLQVLRSIALGMGLPSPQYGAGNYFTPLSNGNHQNLRLLHYPTCKRAEAANRAGEHTDYGSITMCVLIDWF